MNRDDMLKALGERVNAQTRSMGVALTSCTVPAAGTPTFDIGADEIEMGVGIHGEPGRKRVPMMSADDIVDELLGVILADFGDRANGEVAFFVNGFGGTPAMELYLMYNAARAKLEGEGLSVVRSLVGSYVTSLDMAGCALTVTLLDDDLKHYWDAPVHTAALRWGL